MIDFQSVNPLILYVVVSYFSPCLSNDHLHQIVIFLLNFPHYLHSLNTQIIQYLNKKAQDSIVRAVSLDFARP